MVLPLRSITRVAGLTWVAMASFEPTAMIRSAAMAIAWAMVEAGSTVIIRPFLRIMSAGRISGAAGDLGASTCVFAEWLLASAPMTVAPAPAMKWRRRINLFVRRSSNPFIMRALQAPLDGTITNATEWGDEAEGQTRAYVRTWPKPAAAGHGSCRSIGRRSHRQSTMNEFDPSGSLSPGQKEPDGADAKGAATGALTRDRDNRTAATMYQFEHVACDDGPTRSCSRNPITRRGAIQQETWAALCGRAQPYRTSLLRAMGRFHSRRK